MMTVNSKLFSILLITLCASLSQLNASTFRQRMGALFIPERVRQTAANATSRVTNFARRNIPESMQTKFRKFRNTPTHNQVSWALIPFLTQYIAKEEYYERYLTKQCIDINNAIQKLTSQPDFDRAEYDKLQHQRKNLILKIMAYRKFEPCTHKPLLEFIKSIQQDLNIDNDIPVFIGDTGQTAAVYNSFLQTITLNHHNIPDPIILAFAVAHEFGHHFQYTGDPKTYQSKFKPEELLHRFNFSHKKKAAIKDNSFHQEASADANAAEYLDCKACLKHVAELVAPYNERRCSQGYFHSTDFGPYIERAEREGWQCLAHEDFSKKHPGTPAAFINWQEYEPKDFLPQTYDRSGYKPVTTETK